MSENTDICRIQRGDQEFILVGTAHISKESRDLVAQAIEEEHPDTVCVELDDGRLKSLEDPDRWKKTDLKKIIREHQLGTLIANLVLGSYQKRMGLSTGVRPGAELYGAVLAARSASIPVVLADRDIKVTLKRTWSCTPWFRKFSLIASLFSSLFDKTEVSEEELKRIREQDSLSSMMQEFGKTFPEVKSVLIDERDQYLASRIRNAPGKKILAVVGAGHVAGIKKIIEENLPLPAEEKLCEIKPSSPIFKILGWTITAAIIASIIGVGIHSGLDKAGEVTLNWFLYTGGGAMLGAIIAGAHPFAILTALVAAPFTGLTPLIGVGFFVALVQAYMRPPRVSEFETVTEDIWKVSRWWKNRVTRIILCFLLPGFPAIIGKIIALVGIYKAF
ncbi:MAG: TraB/GumN family protein [Hallerella porci]|uniref:Pheromone shutdown-related protein TraB n=1 Tax=Hallerella porci TaxID=1945871 RepID=A0ABX5LS72_9BACT|nr:MULTISPECIES: TraB/GumN family protein [Hallerella]MCI5601066.1 TraB/GumN family protein [Hallerella sp.]MDY3921389.1 TraB/GumN family protein [Hallerella porci]PWL03891.1 pheromone shutdown-related protein TraB [Hallerella porci]